MADLIISDYTTQSNFHFKNLPISYQVFGKNLGTAPIVLVNHALTGNSEVAGDNGWWQSLIGAGKCINTEIVSVLCFDIPGNGKNGFLIDNYEDVSILDVSNWFLDALNQLGIKSINVGIAGSLGGSILWQMAILKPDLFACIIPIATDWKATDWLLAQCRIQKQILNNSENPVHDARLHAMTFYRTPESFKQKFHRSLSEKESLYNVETWLLHHGKKLENRFHLKSYKLMNHLLMTTGAGISEQDFVKQASRIQGDIHLIGIDSDAFYLNNEIKDTFSLLKLKKDNVCFAEINSIHGHDAFLIEYEQLSGILDPIFNSEKIKLKNKYYETTNIR